MIQKRRVGRFKSARGLSSAWNKDEQHRRWIDCRDEIHLLCLNEADNLDKRARAGRGIKSPPLGHTNLGHSTSGAQDVEMHEGPDAARIHA